MSSPNEHFPADYRQARANFFAACEAADLGVTSRLHPGQMGADGKPLFIDVTTIGPREAASAMLLISGTHGVEGYFGSGIQTGLLREGLAQKVPEGTKLVILHALNPFGFSWNRRVNEDNADVNRNFVDFANPPGNDAYDALAEAIAPSDISPDAMKVANAKLRAYSAKNGAFALQEAISKGQYTHAEGIYFGGMRPSWSQTMLKDVFIEEKLFDAERLLVIDFHTGLGDCGGAEMISEELPGTPAYARAKAIWGTRVASSEGGESLSAPLSGTIDKAVAQWLDRTELTFAALEVGTEDTRFVFDALRRDNWLHAYASADHPDAAAIKSKIRTAFYPDTKEWKRRVWAHGEEAVVAALKAIA